MVRTGIVAVPTRILLADDVSPVAAKKAMKLMGGVGADLDEEEANRVGLGAELAGYVWAQRLIRCWRVSLGMRLVEG